MAKKKTTDVSNADILNAILGLTAAIQGMSQVTQNRTSVTEESNTEVKTTTKKGRGRPKKVNSSPKARTTRPKHATGDQIFSEPRPNLFDQMVEKDMFKNEVEEDRAAWGKNKPTPRREPVDFVEIECTSCRKNKKVSPMLVADANQFQCNDCQVGKRRG